MKRKPNLMTLLTLLLLFLILGMVAVNARDAKALNDELEVSALGPQPPTLISPYGAVSTNQPVLSWTPSSTTTSYWVLLFDGKKNIIARWYSAAELGCSSASTCSLRTPALAPGNYSWWVKGRNAQGIGNWSASKTFTYGTLTRPNAPVLASPSGQTNSTPVTFTWTADPGVNEFWVLLFDGRRNVIAQWFNRNQVGCNGSTCVFTPTVSLSGGNYTWWVQARTNGIMSQFSSGLNFNLMSASPTVAPQPPASSVPVLVSPIGSSNTNQPVLTWKPVANATAYWVLLFDGRSNIIARWHTLTELNCSSANCSLRVPNPLPANSYSWWVKPRFGTAEGQWSSGAVFRVDSAPVVQPTAAPVQPTATRQPTAVPVVPTVAVIVSTPAATSAPVQPTATAVKPTQQPTPVTQPGVVVPPPYTTSYYMKTINSTTLSTVGCNIGKQAVSIAGAEELLVTLDWGRPYDMGNGTWGASLFGFGPASASEIGNAIKIAGRAYVQCSQNETSSHLTIGIGTSNYGSQVTEAHGVAWANMVNDVNMWFVSQGLYARVDAVGMNDMELGWNSPSVTRAWVRGYDSVNRFPLYNFGDAAGCATNYYPHWGCNSPWTREDVWWISYGSGASYSVPLIYADTGVNAEQWARLSVYGYETHGLPIEFKGVMTQYQSCIQVGGCGTLDNKPDEGWNYLVKELKRNPATAQYPKYLTDIMWHTDE